MKDKGYFGIGVERIKTSYNWGTLFRTAQIFGADFIFMIGGRFEPQSSDTMKSYRHLPAYSYESVEDFNKHRPYSCPVVGIEMTDDAIPIGEFNHPKQAIYLLGAEDNGMSKAALEICQHVVCLPGKRSLNVSVAGSIVLFDRINKSL